MTFPGRIVLAKRREEAIRAAGLSAREAAVGSRGQAAVGLGNGAGLSSETAAGFGKQAAANCAGPSAPDSRVFCAWGFTPSPLAMRVAQNVLDVCSTSSGRRVIIYVCYAGTHSSVLAACLHLGLVNKGCPVCDLPYFDRRLSADIGVPALVGRDVSGTDVYALGTGWLSAALERAVCDLVELACPDVFACMCAVRGFLDFPARIGGFASRRCALVMPGRALIAASLSRRLPEMGCAVRRCLDLSAKWKDNEGQSKGEVIWFDGSKAGRLGPPG